MEIRSLYFALVRAIGPVYLLQRRPRGASAQTLASYRWGPEFVSRPLHVGFVVDETRSGQVFLGVSPVFPYHKFHSTISPQSSCPFRFISSALMMVRQAWSALAIHGPTISGLHCISSLDPTLCWTRVEGILFISASRQNMKALQIQIESAKAIPGSVKVRNLSSACDSVVTY